MPRQAATLQDSVMKAYEQFLARYLWEAGLWWHMEAKLSTCSASRSQPFRVCGSMGLRRWSQPAGGTERLAVLGNFEASAGPRAALVAFNDTPLCLDSAVVYVRRFGALFLCE